MAGYVVAENQGTEEIEAEVCVAAVPEGLQGFLFRLKQQIVRELVAAVWIGPDGAGEIELRTDGSRIPIHVRATRPKTLTKTI
jgi:RNase P/RNase MRP subunit p29